MSSVGSSFSAPSAAASVDARARGRADHLAEPRLRCARTAPCSVGDAALDRRARRGDRRRVRRAGVELERADRQALLLDRGS